MRVEGTFPKRGLSLRSPPKNSARPTKSALQKKTSPVNAENLAEAQGVRVCHPYSPPHTVRNIFCRTPIGPGRPLY